MIALLLAATLGASGYPRSAADLPALKFCRAVPADSARPGLWDCRRLSNDSIRVFVRAQEEADGSVRYLEWSAEQRLRAVHLPDETFWKILDAFSGEQGEWAERDPGTVGADTAAFPGAVGQVFECLDCPEPLLAGTWGPFGASRLLVARRNAAPRPSDHLGLRAIKEISPLALAPVSSIPCREKDGSCQELRSGPGGTRWHFFRAHPDSAWDSLRVEWETSRFGDSVSLGALHEDLPPKELHALLASWLGAEADLFAANVLAPGAAFLTAPPSRWRARTLPGFLLEARLAQLETARSIPTALRLYEDPWCEAGIDGQIRWMELRRTPAIP